MPWKSICILMKRKGMELIFERSMTFPRTDHSLFPVDHSLPAHLHRGNSTKESQASSLRASSWKAGRQHSKIISYPTTDVCVTFLIQVWITENPGAHCNIINVIGNLVLEHSQDSHHTQASLSNHWTFHSSLSHPPYLSLLPYSSEAPFKPYWHDC